MAFCCCWCGVGGGGGRRARCAIRKGSTWSDCRYKSVSTPKKKASTPLMSAPAGRKLKYFYTLGVTYRCGFVNYSGGGPEGIALGVECVRCRPISGAAGRIRRRRRHDHPAGICVSFNNILAAVSIIIHYTPCNPLHQRALTAAVCLAGCVAMQ